MKIYTYERNKTLRDLEREYHEKKGRKWCEKCQIWFDAASSRRHQH